MRAPEVVEDEGEASEEITEIRVREILITTRRRVPTPQPRRYDGFADALVHSTPLRAALARIGGRK